MSEASAPESAISSKAKEAPKKLQKRVGPKEVKGFYYHAAEYQRQKQKERNVPHRIFRGIIEPFAIHIRAARLKHAAKKYGGEGSAVLDTQFVKQTLDKFWGKSLTEATKQQFKTKAQLHKVFERYDVKKEDVAKIEEATTAVFSKIGNKEELTPEEIQAYAEQTGLSVGDIHHMISVAKENAGIYMTPNQLKGKFTEEAIFSGLSQQQQEQAKKLAHAAAWNSIATTVNYVKTAAVIALMASNPAGWVVAGATIGSAALSGVTRGTRLWKEGQTHFISKARGIDVSHKVKGIERLLGVDWDEDPAKIGRQMTRAIAAGALVALGARFVPTILEHAGEGLHTAATDIHNALDHVSLPKGEVAHNAGVVIGHQEVSFSSVHDHLSGYEQPVKTSFLPDTQHHDWQQLHTFVQQQKLPNGQTVNELKLSYNGVDDGLPHDQHYIDLMMPDGKQVFLQNDAVLAVNGPDGDKLVSIYGLVHEHGHTSFEQIGQVHSSNLAHQLGLDQGRIDNFATLTAKAHGLHGNDGLWHGTQDASDLQTILHNRGLYNNGSSGNALYGVRIGGGYYDAANHVFKIGASNHYYDNKLLTNNLLKEYHAPVEHVEPEQFHSVVGRPLSWIDEQEDRGIDWMFSPHVARALDNFTDLGLNNTDADALAVQHMWEERPWLAPFLLTPYAAMGYFGYLYGKNRAGKKLTIPRAGLNTAAELALLTVLPGAAVTATIGYWIGKMKGRTKKEKAPKQTKTTVTPETAPAGQAATSSAATDSGGLAQATPVAPPTTSVQSTVAGGGNDTAGVTPAPPPPPQPPAQPETPENLPATAPSIEQEPVAPPAPPVTEGLASAVTVEPQGFTPPVAGEVAEAAPETVSAAIPAENGEENPQVTSQIPEVLPNEESANAQAIIPETLATNEGEEEEKKETGEQPSDEPTGQPQQP